MSFKVGDIIKYLNSSNVGVVVETRSPGYSQVQWMNSNITYRTPYVDGSGDCHTINNDFLELDIVYNSPLYKALK